MRRERAGRPQPFPLPGRSSGSSERRRFSPWVGKTPRRRAWRPPQCSCLENPRTQGLCPQRRTRSTDATWRAHTPQNQSPHPTAVEKTAASACLSTSYYCTATEYREIWTQYSALQIPRDGGPACLPACLPPTSRHRRPRDKWEISREDVKGLPYPMQEGREDEKVVVRLGLSGGDAIRILSQQVPRQHPRRDHGNSPPPCPPVRPLALRGGSEFSKDARGA